MKTLAYVNAGESGVGEYGTGDGGNGGDECCGDDASEYYPAAYVGSRYCCDNINDCSIGGTCTSRYGSRVYSSYEYCCRGSAGVDYTLATGVNCPSSGACGSGALLSGSTCYYGIGCGLGGWAGSPTPCSTFQQQGSNCVWDRSCSNSAPYCSYSRSTPCFAYLGDGLCYYDSTCTSSGCDQIAESCHAYLSESTCWHNPTCSNTWGCLLTDVSCPDPSVSGNTLRTSRSCSDSGCSYGSTYICSVSTACDERSGYTCYCTSNWGTSAPGENTAARCSDNVDNNCNEITDCPSEPDCTELGLCCGTFEDNCCAGNTCDGDMYCSTGYYDTSRDWINQNNRCCNTGEYYRNLYGRCVTFAECSPVCWNSACISGTRACCDVDQYAGTYGDDNFFVTTYTSIT